jgi:hypothetical protein
MEHNDKVKAIQHIRTNAEFTLTGDDLVWLDENQTEPTQREIEAGLTAYQLAKESESQTKAQAKAAAEGKLAALGLTTDDLRALGL